MRLIDHTDAAQIARSGRSVTRDIIIRYQALFPRDLPHAGDLERTRSDLSPNMVPVLETRGFRR